MINRNEETAFPVDDGQTDEPKEANMVPWTSPIWEWEAAVDAVIVIAEARKDASA